MVTTGSPTVSKWITNGGKSTWYTVMAVTDPGIRAPTASSAFMVHEDDEGFFGRAQGSASSGSNRPPPSCSFENCRIPGDRIIGEPGTGFKTALATLDHTRPTIGAQAVGIAQALWTPRSHTPRTASSSAVRSPTTRSVQFMLADMAMKVEAARLMVYSGGRSGRAWGEGNLGSSRRPRSVSPPMGPWRSPPTPVQLFGGAGYTVDFPVERMMRDAKITQIYGFNQIPVGRDVPRAAALVRRPQGGCRPPRR